MSGTTAGMIAGLFLLEMCGVEQDQSRKLARGGCCNDLSPESALAEQRNAPTVIQV